VGFSTILGYVKRGDTIIVPQIRVRARHEQRCNGLNVAVYCGLMQWSRTIFSPHVRVRARLETG